MVQREDRNGTRYRANLTLTEHGKIAAEAVCGKVRQAVEQAGRGLTDEDRVILYRALALIAGNLHTICKDGLKEDHAK